MIEGDIESGQNVVVIEDLISTGGSSLKAVDALRDKGCNVKGMVAMDAIALLENLGLSVELKGSGKVKSQSIQVGEQISKNQIIILELK